MRNPFKHSLKIFNSYSKKDRNGIVILSILILVIVVLISVVERFQTQSKTDFSKIEKAFAEWGKNKIDSKSKYLFAFDPNNIPEPALDSLNLPQQVKNNLLKYRNAGGTFKKAEDLLKLYGMNDSIFSEIEKFIEVSVLILENKNKPQLKKNVFVFDYFDPNKINIEKWIQMGFNKNQVNNISKYRSKGGVFYKPDDLLKIYGMDTLLYKQIKKWIRIEEIEITEPIIPQKSEFVVELNSADSIDLVRLNGIGSVFASRIIKYRNILGGFHSAKQLLEVYGFPEETFLNIRNNLEVDTTGIKKLRINYAEYSNFVRHPYLNKVQVSNILKHRDQRGRFNSIEEIRQYNLVDTVTFKKIKPYITSR